MTDEQRYKLARKRVKQLKEFYTHLFSYVVVNSALVVANLMIDPKPFWAGLVLVFWGMGLAFHVWETFGLGSNWEEKKLNELLGQPPKRKNTVVDSYFEAQ